MQWPDHDNKEYKYIGIIYIVYNILPIWYSKYNIE